jgi:cation diffusion facilitator CzcD-associated flavoprotein CzcO
MADFDLIVVGAGPFGLIAAHTCLELHPSDSVMIFESGPDLG